jgi:diacylglycerol kinase
MSKKVKNSFLGFLKGFHYAAKGIWKVARTERNFKIHLTIVLLVAVAGFMFSVSATEWMMIVLVTGLVLSAEMFNTAIESLVDRVSPEYEKTAGQIKDIAAGAVLITAVAAAVVGVIIFGPKIFG